MTVRRPAAPQRAPTSAAAAACCQRSSSGTRNVTRCTSRIARQRSNTASNRRSTRVRAGSRVSVLARRASASASHPVWESCAALQRVSNDAASGAVSKVSSAASNAQTCRRASMGSTYHAFSGIASFRHSLRRLLPSATAAWLAACAQDRGHLVIGAAGPLGDPLGVAMQRAARLAIDQINARGGVAGGRLLDLRFVDDSGNPDVAVRVAQALYDDRRVIAVVEHVTSGPTIAAARVYGSGANPLAVISPSASSPELSGINPWFFRVCPTDVSHGPALARYARQTLGARRAAVLYANDDYGRGIRHLFVAEFRRLGGAVVEEDPYLPATPTLEPYLSRLRQSGGVDVLVLAGEPAGG